MRLKLIFILLPLLIAIACETLPVTPPPLGSEANSTQSPTFDGGVHPTIGEVQRHDDALDKLIAPDTPIQRLADGFDWAEGPVWVKDGGYLLFSDIPPNKIYQWSEAGGLKEFLHPSGYTGNTPRGGEPGSNGLLLDAQGRLVLCQHGDRRIARLNSPLTQPQPNYETLIARYNGKRFNSPNDACFAANGDLYFTDPPYGLEQRLRDPKKELSFQGVYRRRAGGQLTLLTDAIQFPNGIALSVDEKTLYVAESSRQPRIHAFDFQAEGMLGKGRSFFDARPLRAAGKRGGCDGLKLDAAGNLFATGPGGVLVISPEGKHLGTIHTGTAIANVGWGDDGHSLYLTSDNLLCRIRTLTRGAGF